jgi:P4 family phage/plasmid primase-like protien
MSNGTSTVHARQRASTPAGQTRPPSAHIDDRTAATIPPELRNAARCIVWEWAWDKDSGRWRKPPIDPRKPRGSKRRINHLDPKNWMSFEAARDLAHRGGDGVGIAPDPEGLDRLVPLDFDDCLDDAGRIIKPDVARWVKALNSYTEISPSGRGLRTWIFGTVPGKRRRNDQAGVEIYPENQYATITGRHLPGTPTEIRDAQAALDALYHELWPESKPRAAAEPNGKAGGRRPAVPAGPSVRDDEEIIRTAMHSKGFPTLWEGSWEGHFKSQSNADLALVNRLVFYCGPGQEDQVKRLFRRSGLGDRDKAERPDYLDRTVDRAYRGRGHYFDWDRSRPGNGVPPSDGNGSAGPPPNGNGSRVATSDHADGPTNEAMDDPHRLARIHSRRFERQGQLGLRFYRDGWLQWDGSAYRPVKDCELQSGLAGTIKAEFDRLNRIAVKAWEDEGGVGKDGKPADKPETRKVTRQLASNATLALQSTSLLPGRVEAPCWLDGEGPFPAGEIVPTRNTLVHLPSVVPILPQYRTDGQRVDAGRAILKPTPRFFNTYSLDFNFSLDAPLPVEWLKFLGLLWDDDPESIDTLQEWFGYCLAPDTSQQKILSLIGPKRAGKDTIARVLTNLVGAENTAGPTLAGLSSDFGLSPLIGKPLAIVSDARISGRTDAGIIVERLLTISGEGRVDIDRKYQEAWTGKLPTRFVLISNELPRLIDASGALVSRLILLRLTRSFYGREDKGLFNRLVPELPGILLWSIEGWRRLNERGRFIQPASGLELIESLEELSSPVLAFGRERCEFGPGHEVECGALFDAWKEWCTSAGRKEPGTSQSFARDLRAAFPGISTRNTTRRVADGTKSQPRFYVGIDVNLVNF